MKKSRWDKVIAKRFSFTTISINSSKYDIPFFYKKQFIGCLIKRGLKHKAMLKFSNLLYQLKSKHKIEPWFTLYSSVSNIAPNVAMHSFRRGQKVQLYPMPITAEKKIAYGCRWVIKSIADKQKNRNPSNIKILELLNQSLQNKGEALNKKKQTYDLAYLNKHTKRPK